MGLCQPKGQIQGDHVEGFVLTTLALVQLRLGKILPVPRSAANVVNSLYKEARPLALFGEMNLKVRV